MPYCPNPDCPHRERTGKPAEFLEGIERCSDCGTPLVEGPPPIPEEPSRKKFNFVFRDWHKRVLFTLGVLLVYRVFSHMPTPFINYDVFEKYADAQSWSPFGLFNARYVNLLGLGLMPYISAYVLVEILSLVIPHFKTWRASGQYGRSKLRSAALIVAVVIALIQGYFIAAGIERMSNEIYMPFLSYHGFGYRVILSVTLTAGTFLTLWLAFMITSWGIGHGISVLILAGLTARYLGGLSRMVVQGEIGNVAAFISIFVFVSVLVVFAERAQKKLPILYRDGREAFIPFKLTTAGIVPATEAFIPVLATIAGLIRMIGGERLDGVLSPEAIGYGVMHFLMIIFLYYLFTALFYNPRKIIEFLKERNAMLSVSHDNNGERYIDKSLETLALMGALYLCLLVVAPDILRNSLGVPIYFGGVSLIVVVVIALDIFEAIRAGRKSDSLVKIAEVHDVPTAGLMRSVLEGKCVACHLRGYYHRALLYFFGPYIEISVMVPEDRAAEASEAIGKYVGPEFLVQEADTD